MAGSLDELFASIDGVNADDPNAQSDGAESHPHALLYGRRMSIRLAEFMPDASPLLQIAVRAQHIERWAIPRASYPEGRVGYLTWRKDLQKHHAARTGELMRRHGFDEAEIARVGSLLRKERLKHDDEAQALEDVACLVFLEHEAGDFIARHEDDKVRDILAKTARKMSPRGLQAVGGLPLGDRLMRLLGEALG